MMRFSKVQAIEAEVKPLRASGDERELESREEGDEGEDDDAHGEDDHSKVEREVVEGKRRPKDILRTVPKMIGP